MLLLELFEAGAKHVTFCFGRMNPPTIGHKQVLDTMKSQGGDMRIFVSQTQDKKKNPLGLAGTIKTTTAGNGSIKVSLKHTPDKKAATPCSTGETDVELTFPVTIN